MGTLFSNVINKTFLKTAFHFHLDNLFSNKAVLKKTLVLDVFIINDGLNVKC